MEMRTWMMTRMRITRMKMRKKRKVTTLMRMTQMTLVFN